MSEDRLAPALETSFDLLRQRSRLVEHSGALGESDLADWGELCLAAGHAEPARLLYQVAALRAGFSPQLLAAQHQLGNRTSLWQGELARPMRKPNARATTELAIAELTSFASAVAVRPAKDGGKRPFADNIAPEAHVLSPAKAVTATREAEPAELARALFDALRQPPDAAPSIAPVLDQLLCAVEATGPLDARLLAGAPLPLLAEVIGFASLQDFVLGVRDLFSGPHGSAGLFHRAARFDSCGLGPYFGNVSRIARNSSDVLELAWAAAEAAGEEPGSDAVDARWLPLVARAVSGPLLDEVIDDLGDGNRSLVLDSLLTRFLMSGSRRNMARITRIRDAALDNADHGLAARAQRAVVDLDPSFREWHILGTIDGMAGRTAAAEDSFRQCLALAPGDEDVARRLAALRGDFTPYAIPMGFGSPEDRRLTRLRRRRGPAAGAALARASEIGVEVNY